MVSLTSFLRINIIKLRIQIISFFISDLVGSNTILNEVFPARYVTSDEYLLFHSIHNSPRQYHYFDPNNLEINGTIDLIPYLEQGPIVSRSVIK